jgi:hypothetical protein
MACYSCYRVTANSLGNDPRYELYKTALQDGITKITKYDSRFDKKPFYILALCAYPTLIFKMEANFINYSVTSLL